MPLPAGWSLDTTAPGPVAAALPAGWALDPSAVARPEMGAGLTFGTHAVNAFGLLPALGGAVNVGLGKLGFETAAGPGYAAGRDFIRGEMARGKEEHPVAARAGGVASIAPEMLLGGIAGKGVGLAAKATGFSTGLRLGSPLAESVAKGVASGAAYGAAGGAGEALSVGEDVLPAALKAGAVGGLAGGALGAVAHGVGALAKKAGARAEADMLQGVAQGEGTAGSATVRTKKLMSGPQMKANILETLKADPVLLKASRKAAVDALPVFTRKLEEVGSKLDPLYTKVDSVTGGVSVRGLVDHLNAEIAEAGKQPLTGVFRRGLSEIRDDVLNSWAPKFADQERVVADLIKQGVPEAKIPAHLKPGDVKVPTQDLRAMVTGLQTRSVQALGGLTPGETARAKAEFAAIVKDYLDSHLDAAGGRSGLTDEAVKQIRAVNKTYSALSTMLAAIQQRGWKEATGSVTGKGIAGGLLKKGTMLGAGAMALHGNIPGAIGALATHQVVEHLPAAVRAGNAQLARLTAGVQAGNPAAMKIMDAIQQAHRAGTAGAASLGSSAVTTMGAADAGSGGY